MLQNILGAEHKAISYLKQEEISKVLAKAIAQCYQQKPNDPVAFFAETLRNYCATRKAHHDNYNKAGMVMKIRNEYDTIQIQKEEEEANLAKEVEKVESKKEDFLEKISASKDLTTCLQDLSDYLAEHTGATGVYIGKLDFPTTKTVVAEDAGDKDHIDEEAPKVIKYCFASPENHRDMVDRVLTQDQGITHDVFAPKEEEGDVIDEPVNEDAEEVEVDILTSFSGWKYIKEVVREPRIQFQRVPRLGCFMAVPLIYKSCLSEETLDAIVHDSQKQQQLMQEQENERESYEAELATRKAEAEERGDSFKETPRDWEQYPIRPMITQEIQYVVCLDTLGQDCEFTEDQKRFVLYTIKKFREAWEESERRALHDDKDRRLVQTAIDQGSLAEQNQVILDEQEKEIEEILNQREEQITDEEQKEIEMAQLRLQGQGKLFEVREEWKKDFIDIGDYNMLKMPRIVQALMYIIGVDRSKICQPNSNLFCWKRSKSVFLNELPKLMQDFKVMGAKPEKFKDYNTINYVEKLLVEYKDQGEMIESVHPGLGRLFRWLQLAITTRKQDVTRRLAITQKTKKERQEKQELFKDRETSKTQYLVDAEERFKDENREQIEAYEKYQEEQAMRDSQEYGEELDEEEEAKMNADPPEMPKFEPEEIIEKFDSEVELIEIPAEITDDVNNDWKVDEEEIEKIIVEYWNLRGGGD